MALIEPCNELATSWNGILALAVSGTKALLCDLTAFRNICEFPVRWDIGGRRAAIAGNGRVCVTAAYQRGSVVAYDLPEGSQRWCREDIAHPQIITIDPTENTCYCVDGAKQAHALDLTDGHTVQITPQTGDIALDPFSSRAILFRKDYEFREAFTGPVRYHIEPRTFAPIEIAFGPSSWILSESAGPVRALDCASGEILWERFDPKFHFDPISYNTNSNCWSAIRWDYKKTGETFLEQLDLSTGATRHSTRLAEYGVRVWFARQGSIAVSSRLEAWDTDSGARIN